MILDKSIRKQSLLFLFSITLERIGFYGVRAIMVIYMISPTFNMTNAESMNVYAWFFSLLVIAKAIGALLGDFIIGNRKSIIFGGITQAVGSFLLCIPSIYALYLGLFLIILGGGLYSSNLTANYGKLHLNQPKLLDSKFTLLYLFTNIGAFVGAFAIGFLAEKQSFSLGFMIAGITFLLSTITVIKTKEEKNTTFKSDNASPNKILLYIIFVLLLIAFFKGSHNISLMGFYDIDLMFKQNLSSNISQSILSQLDLIYYIPISLALFYFWSKFYYNRLYKIISAFVFGAISFLIILLLQDDLTQSNVILFLISLFFLHLSEIHITPIINSTLTQYSNTKYLASFISISTIFTSFMAMLLYSFGEKFYVNNTLSLYIGIVGMLILAIVTAIYARRGKFN